MNTTIGYVVISEEHRQTRLEQLIEVLYNLRYWSKKPADDFETIEKKAYWSMRADELIKELQVKTTP